jgi:clan AA aspartic protease (TIGR02281 family)
MAFMAALILALGIGVGVVVGDGMRAPCPPPSKRAIVRTTPTPAPNPTVAPIPGRDVFEAERDGDSGLFVIHGRTTGDEIAFAVDTGAEITIVRERDAEALGARTTTDGDQNVVVVGSVLPMTGAVIPRMRIANVDLENVRVLVGPDTLPFSLLGQHEISRLGSVEFDGDTMRVRPSNVPESLD